MNEKDDEEIKIKEEEAKYKNEHLEQKKKIIHLIMRKDQLTLLIFFNNILAYLFKSLSKCFLLLHSTLERQTDGLKEIRGQIKNVYFIFQVICFNHFALQYITLVLYINR